MPKKGFRVSDWLEEKFVEGQTTFVPIDGYHGQTVYKVRATQETMDIRPDFERLDNHYIVKFRSLNTDNATLTAQTGTGEEILSREAFPQGSQIIFTAHPTNPNMVVEDWFSNNEPIQDAPKTMTYTVESLMLDLDIMVLCVEGGTDEPESDYEIVDNHLVRWSNASGEITIPDEVTHIDAGAFKTSPDVEGITLNANLQAIDELAFVFAGKLSHFVVPKENKYFAEIDGVLYNHDFTELIAYPGGRPGDSYTIDPRAQRIKPGAFAFSPRLAAVEVDNDFLKSDNGIIYSKDMKTLIYHPNSSARPDNDKITIIEGVEQIGRLALSFFIPLKEIKLPASLKTIDAKAFFNSMTLTKIEFAPDAQLQTIGESAFAYARSLEVLPYVPSLRTIEQEAFAIASELKEIHIPVGCTIADRAFDHVWALKDIYAYDVTPAAITETTFTEIEFLDECTLYVPKGSKNAYANAVGWKQFVHIVEVDGLAIGTIDSRSIAVRLANGRVLIDGVPEFVSYRLIDLNGNTLFRGTASETTISIEAPVAGSYLVILETGQVLRLMVP